MRITVVAAVVCLGLVGLSQADDARASMRRPTNIPAQSLGPALKAFAQARDLQVLYLSETVRDLRTGGATGELTTDEALTQLLSGTGLTYRYVSDKAVTILAARSAEGGGSASGTPISSNPDSNQAPVGDSQKEDKKSFLSRFLLAQAAPGQAATSSAVDKKTERASNNKPITLEEVIVTAEKRDERLQDVPVPVTAISADTLVDTNQLRLQDYYTSVPGLSVAAGDFHASPMLAIRGITTGGGFTTPTVGIVVDDVPYGSSTGNGGGYFAPDIDPSDLAHVEVLRGPQGTLYGASSIGGLLKFVTVNPSTDGLRGRLEAGISTVQHGADTGYNFRGSVNIPLSDTFAVRASGFTHQDPGYVDNVVTGERGVNQGVTSGGRLSAMWLASEAVSLKLSALIQDNKVHGSPYVDVGPGLGNWQQNNIPRTGPYSTRFEAYSATLTAKLGSVDLTAISGYGVNSNSDAYDFTQFFASFTQAQFGVTGTPTYDYYKTDKFSQEIRFSGSISTNAEWLFGGFYTHEKSDFVQDILAANPVTGVPVGSWNHADIPTTFAEYAAFANLTYHATDRFDVQLGGRESENKQTFTETEVGPLVGGQAFTPEVHTKENAFTYLVTPRFKVSRDLMVYARLASGYRAGGPNQNQALGVPPSFKPDKTQNYEVGVKGDVLDHALSFDASLYYINWKDIQLNLINAKGAGYVGNVGQAKSQGVELSLESRPLSGLTVAAWVALADAELTEAFPPTSTAFGVSGDRLPYSSRFSGNFSIEKEFSLTNAMKAFVGASVSHVGDRKGQFTGSAQRQIFPAYSRSDLRAGVKYQSWTVNVYLTNLADVHGVLTGGLGTFSPSAFDYIPPRTGGLSVTKTF